MRKRAKERDERLYSGGGDGRQDKLRYDKASQSLRPLGILKIPKKTYDFGASAIDTWSTATKPSLALKSWPPTVMLWLIPSLVFSSNPDRYCICDS